MTPDVYTSRHLHPEISDINLLEASPKEMLQISRELGIGLTLEEMKRIKEYFSNKGRNPTDVELQTIGQTWSEHCYHRTFKGNIVTPKEKLIATNMLKQYIAKVTRELNPPWCLSVFEDNAGIVEFENGYAIAAKVETHNHPSAIEPFGGAATGIGGVIRDILGVWADPIVCTDVLCFGPLDYDYEKLPPGTKHPKYLFKGVVAGIGHYGNNMGIPTVNGAICFDESYVGNVVVYCGCVGLLPMDKFSRNTRPGDVAVLAGGRTGRDGIHGVTFASAELTEKSEEVSRPAVQIANPIEEEKLKRAIIEIRDRELGSSITDLGGGGLSCATGEMAYRSGGGVHVELGKVLLKYPGIAPWEIFVSESQERMLLSVREKNLQKVLDIFDSEDTEATPVGKFTEDRILLAHCRGQKVVELDLHFLFHPPLVKRFARYKKARDIEPSFAEPSDLTPYLLEILSSPYVASKESVIRTYDHEVKGNTVLKPLQGRYSGPNDAAVIKPLPKSWKGIVISCGINPNYGKIDPYWMAASAIDEAIRNNVAVGGRRIALLDNFTWGSPEKPDRVGSLIRACQACYDFAKAFKTPFISGKDSLYNEFRIGPDISIPVIPTLLITAIGIIPDVRRTVSTDVKAPGNLIYMVGQTYPELGGSEYYRLRGFVGKTVPKVRGTQAKRTVDSIVEANDSGYLKSCHDISEGGLAVAAAEMAFSGGYGVRLTLKSVPRARNMRRNDHILFSESNSRFLVEVPDKYRKDFEAIMAGNVCSAIGHVEKNGYLSIYGLSGKKIISTGLDELRTAWKKTFRGQR